MSYNMNAFTNFSLFTDFYELTMMQGYFYKFPDQHSTFEMFYRHQPFNGGYSIFAGLDPLLDAIQGIKFSKSDIQYLNSLKMFKKDFLDFLLDFAFTGDIHSIKEGSVVFPIEPMLRVTGTIIETQFIESIVLNFINFQTLVATKTSRITDIAGNKPVLEFGLRRAQGTDGALSATRAAYIGGATSTSNTLAGNIFKIPVSGTMAHSWIMSADSELEAFEKYADLYPKRCVLLVDTFDTIKSGIPNAIKVFRKLKRKKPELMAIRIDSGDLEYLSIKAKELFDKAGLPEVKIFVSSDIDEWIIKQINNNGAPIDAWGVGTRLITGGNDPALSGVYKVVAMQRGDTFRPCIKISNQPEKITNPGVKNIMRFYINGSMQCDLLYLENEELQLKEKIKAKESIQFNHPSADYSSFILRNYDRAVPLLEKVMSKGKRTNKPMDLIKIREYRQSEIDCLDRTYRRLLNPHTYKVSISDNLKNLKSKMIEEIRGNFNYEKNN